MPPWGWVFSLSFWLEFSAWVLVFSAAGVKKKEPVIDWRVVWNIQGKFVGLGGRGDAMIPPVSCGWAEKGTLYQDNIITFRQSRHYIKNTRPRRLYHPNTLPPPPFHSRRKTKAIALECCDNFQIIMFIVSFHTSRLSFPLLIKATSAEHNKMGP